MKGLKRKHKYIFFPFFFIEAELKIISYFSLNPRSILISPFNFNFSNRQLYQADMFFWLYRSRGVPTACIITVSGTGRTPKT